MMAQQTQTDAENSIGLNYVSMVWLLYDQGMNAISRDAPTELNAIMQIMGIAKQPRVVTAAAAKVDTPPKLGPVVAAPSTSQPPSSPVYEEAEDEDEIEDEVTKPISGTDLDSYELWDDEDTELTYQAGLSITVDEDDRDETAADATAPADVGSGLIAYFSGFAHRQSYVDILKGCARLRIWQESKLRDAPMDFAAFASFRSQQAWLGEILERDADASNFDDEILLPVARELYGAPGMQIDSWAQLAEAASVVRVVSDAVQWSTLIASVGFAPDPSGQCAVVPIALVLPYITGIPPVALRAIMTDLPAAPEIACMAPLLRLSVAYIAARDGIPLPETNPVQPDAARAVPMPDRADRVWFREFFHATPDIPASGAENHTIAAVARMVELAATFFVQTKMLSKLSGALPWQPRAWRKLTESAFSLMFEDLTLVTLVAHIRTMLANQGSAVPRLEASENAKSGHDIRRIIRTVCKHEPARFRLGLTVMAAHQLAHSSRSNDRRAAISLINDFTKGPGFEKFKNKRALHVLLNRIALCAGPDAMARCIA